MAKVKRADGVHYFLTGMSRSGKTAVAFQLAAASTRVIVWDPQPDWLRYGYTKIESIGELTAALKASATSPARLSVKLPRAQFEAFCRVAFAWAKIQPATIIVEELAWVTHPGKAPEGWHELVTGCL